MHDDTSQNDLDAMLYVLEDPALDRESFESRMADDPNLAHAVANAVYLTESLRHNQVWESFQSNDYPCPLPDGIVSETRAWTTNHVFLATVCASIAIALITWRAMPSNPSHRQSLDEVAITWTAMQSNSIDSNESPVDGIFSHDLEEVDSSEWGAPAWLIMATAVHDLKSMDAGIQ